jgi:uncharacterized RDD family membrane protein YckC
MRRLEVQVAALVVALIPCMPAAAQDTTVQPRRWTGPVLRIGLDYMLPADEAVREVVVVSGNALIEGRIDQNVVVVFGTLRLTSTAMVDRDLVVVGGSATIAEGAAVGGDLVVVGGELEAPPGFAPGQQEVIIAPAAIGARMGAVVPWITRGLLWGRPIVPDLPWVWGFVGLFFVMYLLLNVVLDRPVRACSATMAERPLTAFAVGLLMLLLIGPVCLLLAVSVVGLAVVPFVLCTLVAAGVVGRLGVMRWIGASAVGEESENRLHALRSFAIGFAIVTLAYIVPLLGLVVFATLRVFGLGAAALAFLAGYRHESPVRSRSFEAARRAQNGDEVVVTVPAERAADRAGLDPTAVQPLASAELVSLPRAPFRDRLAAFVLDVILVVISRQLMELNDSGRALLLFLLAYHIGFWTWKGTTVGGIICQLRVVRVDGAPVRFVDALVRGLSSIFSLAVLGMGGLWILRDPERQAWHDKIAGTYVVKVPRNWPL